MRHPVRRIAAIALCVAVGIAVVSTAQDATLPDAGVEAKLKGMSYAEQDRYVEVHPKLADEAANSDPTLMAGWWDSLTKDGKADLVKTIPDSIGNLDGVDYTTRDKANRVHLARALHEAAKAVAKSPSQQVTLRLASLQAIQKTLAGAKHPRRYLVSLSDDTPALAAIAVGDLDTAEQITFAVPGMGTYTTDMQLWTQAAQNIYDEQGLVGAPKKRAVVSWMGYVPPPQGIEASRGIYAQQGAPLLRSDIGGVFAVRHDDDGLAVNVVAHSYGTTTSADALYGAKFELYAVVFVGSAGIETTVPNAAALHAAHVYAAEAANDPLARFGRESRVDPRSPAFGATVFHVDGVPGADDAHGVTGHEPILHSAWNDNAFSSAWKGYLNNKETARKFAQHMQQFGYLDLDTESLYNIAVATTPATTYKLL